MRTVYFKNDTLHNALASIDMPKDSPDIRAKVLITAPWVGSARATIVADFVFTKP